MGRNYLYCSIVRSLLFIAVPLPGIVLKAEAPVPGTL
jgi:hypothetical protein